MVGTYTNTIWGIEYTEWTEQTDFPETIALITCYKNETAKEARKETECLAEQSSGTDRWSLDMVRLGASVA